MRDYADAERADLDRTEADRAEADRAEADRVEADQVEADRAEADQAELDRADFEPGASDSYATGDTVDDVTGDQPDVDRAEMDADRAEPDVDRAEPDVDRAEMDLAAAEERDDAANQAEVERAEADLAAAEAGDGEDSAGFAPVPPEPVVATAVPVEASGVVVGSYEGPTAVVPTDVPSDVDNQQPGGDLKPGEADTTPVGAVWDDSMRQGLRDRWRDVQLRFVDDPGGTVNEAQSLVDEAVDRYTEAMRNKRQELDSWRSGNGEDTEVLRAALRRYRDFLDSLLGV